MTAIGFTWFFRGAGGLEQQRRLHDRRARRHPPLRDPGPPAGHVPVRPAARARCSASLVGVAYFITTVLQACLGPLRGPGAGRLRRLPGKRRPDLGHARRRRSDQHGPGPDRDPPDRGHGGRRLPALAPQLAERAAACSRPVLATGGVAFLFLLIQLIVGQAGLSRQVELVAFVAAIAVFACLPFAFLVGLLRSRIGRDEEIRTALTAENAQLNAELAGEGRRAARLAHADRRGRLRGAAPGRARPPRRRPAAAGRR